MNLFAKCSGCDVEREIVVQHDGKRYCEECGFVAVGNILRELHQLCIKAIDGKDPALLTISMRDITGRALQWFQLYEAVQKNTPAEKTIGNC